MSDMPLRPCALVLGAAVRPDGRPSPTLELRLRHAVALYHAGQVSRICCSGGVGRFGPAEGIVARDLARALGVAEADVFAEVEAKSTFENIAFSAPLIEGPIMLVSNRWHLPRAWLIARLMGLRVTLSGPPAAAPLSRVVVAILREVATTPRSTFQAIMWARRTGR